MCSRGLPALHLPCGQVIRPALEVPISGGGAECALLRQNEFDWCIGEFSCCTGG